MIAKIITGYMIILNLLAFLAMWSDKRRARKGRWRIPERTLFLLSFLGGSIGSLAGMVVFHHKTKHRKFVLGMPGILLFHVAVMIVLGNYIEW